MHRTRVKCKKRGQSVGLSCMQVGRGRGRGRGTRTRTRTRRVRSDLLDRPHKEDQGIYEV